jgi:hypothetical protein
VDGKLACEATLMCAVVPRERKAQGDSAETSPDEVKAPTAPPVAE